MEQFERLFSGYVAGSLTKPELREFLSLLEAEEDGVQQGVFRLLEEGQTGRSLPGTDLEIWAVIEKKIKMDKPKPSIQTNWRRYVAAASIILALGIAVYFGMVFKSNVIPTMTTAHTEDVTPGTAGAILTLSDGSQVVLDSLGNGTIALQNGSTASLENGALTYVQTGEATTETVYNTMTTPKGRQFSLSLPDGTKVWLNAGSSIRYPTEFTGGERNVAVYGEVYFEVAKDTKRPFQVMINDQMKVRVYGTHFNVNAYDDEGIIKTTLIEGAISANGTMIKPGQQAILPILDVAGQSTESLRPVEVINDANMSKIMAWRNGVFNFEGSDIQEVMRQLERWYDIEVTYMGKIPNISFFGEINRNENLSVILKALEDSGIRFKFSAERRLTILPE